MDQYFRETLNSPDLKYSKQDWKKMEQLLRPARKRRKMAAIYWLSGIAALLLVFLSLWLFRADEVAENNQSNTNSAKTEQGKQNDKPLPLPKAEEQIARTGEGTGTSKSDTDGKQTRTAVSGKTLNLTDRMQVQDSATGNKETELLSKVGTLGVINSGELTANNGILITASSDAVKAENKALNTTKDDTKPAEESKVKNSKWAVSLAFSPDFNTVNNFKESSFGAGAGIGVSYQLNKNLALGTGIAYAKKLYSAAPSAYKSDGFYPGWLSKSSAVDADCRVLDIPLNINYLLDDKKGRKFVLSAGMSSYIMLKEKYTYIGGGGTPYPGQPVTNPNPSYSLSSENRHILSVITIGAGVVRPLNNQTSIVIQPYAKLPLTGIGQGQVNLKSFGVSLQLNYGVKKK